jgi:hypothetical protein
VKDRNESITSLAHDAITILPLFELLTQLQSAINRKKELR